MPKAVGNELEYARQGSVEGGFLTFSKASKIGMSNSTYRLPKSDFLLTGTALNMFDSWLPIASLLKDKGLSGAVVIPYDFILERSHPSDTTLSLAENIFNSVFVVSDYQLHWFDSLKSAWAAYDSASARVQRRGSISKRNLRRVRRLMIRISGLGTLIEHAFAKRILETVTGRALLYDFSIRTENNMMHDKLERLAQSGNWRIFSLSHTPVPIPAGESPPENLPSNWTSFWHLRPSIGQITPKNTSTVLAGIPRHDKDWIQQIVSASKSIHKTPTKPYVVLLSHGGGGSYPFSEKSKLQVIARVSKLLSKRGIGLVVKKHPTELLDNGEGYSLSNAHTLHLLSGAEAMLVFLSSTVADGMVMGKPIIQLLEIASSEGNELKFETWIAKVGAAFEPSNFIELETLFDEIEAGTLFQRLEAMPRYSDLVLAPDNDLIVSLVMEATQG